MGHRFAAAQNLLAPILFVFAAASGAAPPAEVERLLADDRYEQALAASETYLETHPDDARARFQRGVALAGLARNEEAMRVFRALAESHPDWPEPANNLAVLLARQGDYEAARRWLDSALGTQPAYATAHANLGDVYAALAADAYRKALDEGERKQTDDVRVSLDMVTRLYRADEPAPPAGVIAYENAGEDDAAAESDAPASRTGAPAEDGAAGSEAAPEEPAQPPASHAQTAAVAERGTGEAEEAGAAPESGSQQAREAVLAQVERWRSAWAAQDADAYLAAYAEDFDPEGERSLESWRALRRDRITRPEWIEVTISDARTELREDGRARVSFDQRYRSDGYADRVRKTLILARGEEGWRIVRETDRPL